MKVKLLLISLVLTINVCAQVSLTAQLKQIDPSLPEDSKTTLVMAAELVGLLDFLQLHGVAAVAAEHQQWPQAGFYYMAANMRYKVDAYVFDLTQPKAVKEIMSSHGDRRRAQQLAFEIQQDPIFDWLKQRNKQAFDLTQNNQLIKLHLLRHTDDLQAAVELYALWKPTYSESYVTALPSEARLSPVEADLTFKRLNEVYLQSNHNILKLMENPRYQQLMIEKQLAFMDWSYAVFDSGYFEKDQASIVLVNKREREIERIEMEQLLFPEKDWGWYR